MFSLKKLFFFLIVGAMQVLHADYVLIKRDVSGAFQLLDRGVNATEKQVQELYRIMMTYEWPMSAAAYEFGKITREEAEELFAPGVDAGEQKFMRKKIHESVLLGPDFDLAFVPKTLYELFAASHIYSLGSAQRALVLAQYLNCSEPLYDDMFAGAAAKFDLADFRSYYKYLLIGYDFYETVFGLKDESGLRAMAAARHVENHTKILADPVRFGGGNPDEEPLPQDYSFKDLYFDINRALGSIILADSVAGLAGGESILSIEHAIKAHCADVAERCLPGITPRDISFAAYAWKERITTLVCPDFIFPRIDAFRGISPSKITPEDGIFLRTIDAEYKLRQKNYAFLMRVPGWSSKKGMQLHNHLLDVATPFGYGAQQGKSESPDNGKTHSLSFGNSLFAGAIFDHGACVYDYAKTNETCYLLELDKYAYVLGNHCDGLFLVSPLPTIIGLMGSGEVFHSRTLARSPGKEGGIGGLVIGQKMVKAPDFLRADGELFHQEWWYQMYFLEHAHVIKSPITPAVFFKSSRALASAMKSMWEHQLTVDSQKKLEQKKQAARAVLTKALQRKKAARAAQATTQSPELAARSAGVI